jgi:hypothetical protein
VVIGSGVEEAVLVISLTGWLVGEDTAVSVAELNAAGDSVAITGARLWQAFRDSRQMTAIPIPIRILVRISLSLDFSRTI